jgi:hypothetical protein
MAKPAPLEVCIGGRHGWSSADPFNSGDTCECGRYYLRKNDHGFRFEVFDSHGHLSAGTAWDLPLADLLRELTTLARAVIKHMQQDDDAAEDFQPPSKGVKR